MRRYGKRGEERDGMKTGMEGRKEGDLHTHTKAPLIKGLSCTPRDK